jgi:hypothetical protein
VADVDQRRVTGPRRLDPRARVVDAPIERNGDDDERLIPQLLVDGLPDRQIETAASP